jgi:hypothetical protein
VKPLKNGIIENLDFETLPPDTWIR